MASQRGQDQIRNLRVGEVIPGPCPGGRWVFSRAAGLLPLFTALTFSCITCLLKEAPPAGGEPQMQGSE